MKSQTSLVSQQVCLAEWAEQIRACQNRPSGMKVDDWCAQNGITKATYYWRLRKVREACIDITQNNSPSFVEIPFSPEKENYKKSVSYSVAAVLHGTGDISMEITNNASAEFIKHLIGAFREC